MFNSLFKERNTFSVRVSYIARPQHRCVFAGQIVAQKVMSIALFGVLDSGVVELKGKGSGMAGSGSFVSARLTVNVSGLKLGFEIQGGLTSTIVGTLWGGCA